MAGADKTYDVFISHSARDAALALEVSIVCRRNDLEAFTGAEVLPGVDLSDVLWNALAESRALLAVLSPSGPTPSMAIEIGAARAWNKPIYAVVTDPSTTRLPPALAGIQLYTTGKLQDVVQAIKQGVQPLSEVDRAYLTSLYSQMAVPVDQLALDPRQLENLMKRFNRSRKKNVSGERLLSELLRLRKQGKLVTDCRAKKV